MKKTVLWTLLLLSLIVLFLRFGIQPLVEAVGVKPKAGIKITTTPVSSVSINDTQMGTVPYENDNLSPGEVKVKVAAKDSFWEGWVKLTAGTVTVINRELASNIASSSGEILTLNSGKGAMVTSSPSEAEVEIDGKVYGKTPLVVSDLPAGEHTFLLSRPNYLKRSIRASLPSDLLLHIAVDLAISEADMESSPVVATTPDESKKVTVKQTPTGFLRVRSKPSLGGAEVARVSPGDKLTLVEELSGWVKVRLDSGTEGYVSSSYVQKQSS